MLNRHFSIYLGAHLVPAVIGFFAITIYTRLLNPHEYGVYVVGMGVAGILGAVCFAWIRLSVARYQATSADVDFRGTALLAFGLTVFAISSLAPAALLLFQFDISIDVMIASIFVAVAVGAFDISQEFQRATLRPLRFAVIAVARSGLTLIFGVAAIRLGYGGFGLIMALGSGALICALMNMAGSGHGTPKWQGEQLKQFARYGLPLSIGGLSNAIYTTSDRLIVAYLLGQGATGLFGVAADLPRQFMVMLGSSVAAATVPILFRTLAKDGRAATRERLNENAELLLAVVCPVVVWLALAADQVAGTFVGPEFRASVSLLLPVLALARLCGVINQFYVQISFQLAERSLLLLFQACFTMLVSIAAMFPLILYFGLFGAALATLFAEAFGLVLAVYLARRAFPMPFDIRRLSGVLAAALAMAGAISLAKMSITGTGFISLAAISLIGGTVYAAAIWFFDVARLRTLTIAALRRRRLLVPGFAGRKI